MAEAKVKIGIENSGFERGLAAMRGQITSWKDDIKSSIAGAFTFGAALTFFNNLRQEAGRIDDLAKRFGQTREGIQQVSNVAKVSGTDIEQLASILEKLSLSAAEGSDKFKQVGINAAEFVGADYQGRILMLADAWEKTNGSVQAQADLMSLLGAKGADLLPLLSKGVKGLQEEFAAVPTMADGAIEAITQLNDTIDTLVMKAQQAAGSVIGLAKAGFSLAAAWFEDGGDSEKMWANYADRMASQQDATGTTKNDLKNPKADAAAEDAKTKADAARVALEEKMKDLARSRMSDEEKITDLEKEKAALAAKAQDATASEEARLKAAKDMLDVQQQIEAIQSRIQKTKDDEAKTITDLEAKAAGMEDQQKLAAMDPAARAEELKKRQKALFDEAAAAEKDADRKRAAEKRIEALSLADDITRAQKEAEAKEKDKEKDKLPKDQRPGIVSSSLGAIGGGGGVYIAQGLDPALQEARNQTSLLRMIATNTARGGTADPGRTSNPF